MRIYSAFREELLKLAANPPPPAAPLAKGEARHLIKEMRQAMTTFGHKRGEPAFEGEMGSLMKTLKRDPNEARAKVQDWRKLVEGRAGAPAASQPQPSAPPSAPPPAQAAPVAAAPAPVSAKPLFRIRPVKGTTSAPASTSAAAPAQAAPAAPAPAAASTATPTAAPAAASTPPAAKPAGRFARLWGYVKGVGSDVKGIVGEARQKAAEEKKARISFDELRAPYRQFMEHANPTVPPGTKQHVKPVVI